MMKSKMLSSVRNQEAVYNELELIYSRHLDMLQASVFLYGNTVFSHV